jgi:Mrp family chromosome partitioning ATPase
VLGSPDARILSELADMVVLVAGYGLVTPEKIEAALASFPSEKVAGVVFNNLP